MGIWSSQGKDALNFRPDIKSLAFVRCFIECPCPQLRRHEIKFNQLNIIRFLYSNIGTAIFCILKISRLSPFSLHSIVTFEIQVLLCVNLYICSFSRAFRDPKIWSLCTYMRSVSSFLRTQQKFIATLLINFSELGAAIAVAHNAIPPARRIYFLGNPLHQVHHMEPEERIDMLRTGFICSKKTLDHKLAHVRVIYLILHIRTGREQSPDIPAYRESAIKV